MLTVYRLVELTDGLGADAATVLRRGLQRARLSLENKTLDIDLHALITDCKSGPVRFRSLAQWARNALTENPGGVLEVEAAAVRNLALFIGCSHRELATYLAQFMPPTDGAAHEEADAPNV
jgi:hypothetical protein